jgi:hypothetical protein
MDIVGQAPRPGSTRAWRLVVPARPAAVHDRPLWGHALRRLGRAQYPNLLSDNRSHVAFSIFDGDLQAGGDGPCNDSLYTTSLANFNKLRQPLIWVPGDNDWTDCWGRYGAAQAPYHDPIERLNFERQLFDKTNQSLGQRTLTLKRESRPTCTGSTRASPTPSRSARRGS